MRPWLKQITSSVANFVRSRFTKDGVRWLLSRQVKYKVK